MTVAVCTNCGELKHGAWCTCPLCESDGLDADISILLSDHNLSEDELRHIGAAIHVIHGTGLDEEKRFHVLTYFLSRKWPKLLEYDIDAVEPQLQKELDGFYRARLAGLPGQKEPDLKVSPVRRRTWSEAMGAAFQGEDDAWQGEVRGMLLNGMEVAKLTVSLKIEAGEGTVLQRLTHFVRGLFHCCDYRRLAGRATGLVGDASEYRRTVNAFCARVKNGWSDRTKQQAAYFRGLCQRLEEMANNAKVIIEHKAGINRMIALDVKRVRQEFSQSYRTFIELSYVVLDPSRINPDGTCKSG
jgi:hypothetical protein